MFGLCFEVLSVALLILKDLALVIRVAMAHLRDSHEENL